MNIVSKSINNIKDYFSILKEKRYHKYILFFYLIGIIGTTFFYFSPLMDFSETSLIVFFIFPLCFPVIFCFIIIVATYLNILDSKIWNKLRKKEHLDSSTIISKKYSNILSDYLNKQLKIINKNDQIKVKYEKNKFLEINPDQYMLWLISFAYSSISILYIIAQILALMVTSTGDVDSLNTDTYNFSSFAVLYTLIAIMVIAQPTFIDPRINCQLVLYSSGLFKINESLDEKTRFSRWRFDKTVSDVVKSYQNILLGLSSILITIIQTDNIFNLFVENSFVIGGAMVFLSAFLFRGILFMRTYINHREENINILETILKEQNIIEE